MSPATTCGATLSNTHVWSLLNLVLTAMLLQTKPGSLQPLHTWCYLLMGSKCHPSVPWVSWQIWHAVSNLVSQSDSDSRDVIVCHVCQLAHDAESCPILASIWLQAQCGTLEVHLGPCVEWPKASNLTVHLLQCWHLWWPYGDAQTVGHMVSCTGL